MQKLIRVPQFVLVCAVVVAVMSAPAGQARSSETIACSSTATSKISLTGTWIGSDRATYRIRQVGTCVWWAATTTAFLGTVSSTGSSVYGLWASVAGGGSGSVIISVKSSTVLSRRASTGGFPASSWKRTAS